MHSECHRCLSPQMHSTQPLMTAEAKAEDKQHRKDAIIQRSKQVMSFNKKGMQLDEGKLAFCNAMLT